MKTEFRKALSTILILLFCTAATITGFTVSAAHSAQSAAYGEGSGGDNRPALKDGVWQAVYEDGADKLFFIEEKEHSFSMIDPDLGIGLPSRFDYDGSAGIYKLHIACEDNEENWRVIDNSGKTATVSDANGRLITLYYISGETFDSFGWYSLSELREMARGYYSEHYGGKDVEFTASISEDGSFFATITGTENGVEVASYTVDMITASGADGNCNKVDLSPYIRTE